MNKRSFWSTMPGVFTAIGGAVTAAVGLVTLSTQLGWLDSDDDKTVSGNGAETTTQSTTRDSGDGSDDGGDADGDHNDDAPIEFEVDPTTVSFKLLVREETVTVRNTGQSPFTPEDPDITGANADEFTASDVSCADKRLTPGGACQVRVSAPKTPGSTSATLVIPLDDETKVEVPLQDTLL